MPEVVNIRIADIEPWRLIGRGRLARPRGIPFACAAPLQRLRSRCRRTATRLLLVIDVRERLPAMIADREARSTDQGGGKRRFVTNATAGRTEK